MWNILDQQGTITKAEQINGSNYIYGVLENNF